jgi:hypothetical protein
VLPLLELAEDPDSSYVAFVEQLQRSGDAPGVLDHPDVVSSREQFADDMQRLLAHVAGPARDLRIALAQDVALHVAAERERSLKRDEEVVPFALFVSATVDGLAGLLGAPASDETRRLTGRRSAAAK